LDSGPENATPDTLVEPDSEAIAIDAQRTNAALKVTTRLNIRGFICYLLFIVSL
jgi:hypothetical protein